jgi:hypothetical protein
MSYGVAAALQAAVFQRLQGDVALTALVGTAVYDNPPSGAPLGTYVSLGPEDVRDRSSKTGYGALHVLTISVVTDLPGFHNAKLVAAAVNDALNGAALALVRGTLVSIDFDRAVARRVAIGDVRRIDLKFRARVEDA